jgi:hypothetical protein
MQNVIADSQYSGVFVGNWISPKCIFVVQCVMRVSSSFDLRG